MDWSAALVAILVALIAASAGFAGGYLGSRWTAETQFAHWRRDKLLEFCAGFMDTCADITMHRKGPHTNQDLSRVAYGLQRIVLLSPELTDPADEYVRAIRNVVKEVAETGGAPGEELTAIEAAASKKAGNFMFVARRVLAMPEQPTAYSRVASRISSAWAAFVAHLNAPPPKTGG